MAEEEDSTATARNELEIALTAATPKEEIVRCLAKVQERILRGDAESFFLTGRLYSVGIPDHCPQNTSHGLKALQTAAEQGHLDAQISLSETSDLDAAQRFKWCKAAAEQGDLNSLAVLGNHYAKGFGIPKVDMKRAVEHWTAAAAANHMDAAYNLGLWYLTQRKDQLALRFLTRAADAGDVEAQLELGNCWFHMRAQPLRAQQCWQRAAAAGNRDALVNLGLLAMEQNEMETAKTYLKQAADLGDLEAKQCFDDLLLQEE